MSRGRGSEVAQCCLAQASEGFGLAQRLGAGAWGEQAGQKAEPRLSVYGDLWGCLARWLFCQASFLCLALAVGSLLHSPAVLIGRGLPIVA